MNIISPYFFTFQLEGPVSFDSRLRCPKQQNHSATTPCFFDRFPVQTNKPTTSFFPIFLHFQLADPVSFDIDSRLRCPRQQNRLRTAQQLLLASSTDLSPELMSCYGSLNVCPRLISELWFSLKVRISQTQPAFYKSFFLSSFYTIASWSFVFWQPEK